MSIEELSNIEKRETKIEENNTLEERIEYYEMPAVAIAKNLKSKGYEIADFDGMKINEADTNIYGSNYELGILKRREPVLRRNFPEIVGNFLGMYTLHPAEYKGKLLLAADNKRWTMEVYGRQNIRELTELAKKLVEPYDSTKVQIILKTENPKWESFLIV